MAKKPDASPEAKERGVRPRPQPRPRPERATDNDLPITTRRGLSLSTDSGKPLMGDLPKKSRVIRR